MAAAQKHQVVSVMHLGTLCMCPCSFWVVLTALTRARCTAGRHLQRLACSPSCHNGL